MKLIKSALIALLLCAITAGLIVYSDKVKSGASYGLSLAGGVVIPSLLPVLIIVSTLQKSKGRVFFEKLLGFVFGLLKFSRGAVTPVIFGLVGGFPAGALLTEMQLKNGCLGEHEARRIMRFNMCGGVAFIISAVGGGYYKSTKAGLIIYASTVLSSVIIAIVSAFFTDKSKSENTHTNDDSLSGALCSAVEDSTKSVLVMSAYIILFCAIKNTISISDALLPLIEITSGIFSQDKLTPEWAAFFIGFGGLCIHFQLLLYLKNMGVKYTEFFIYRVLSGTLSYFICKILLTFFPVSISVFESGAERLSFEFTQINTAFGIIVMLGAAVIILDIENRKIKL